MGREPGELHGLRFGLIGCGNIGHLRARALAGCDSHRLVAVADREADRASALADEAGVETAPDLEALLSRDDVDALIVCTPPASHADLAGPALEAGRHVLCEKPLARTPGECRSLLAAAEAGGAFLATGFNYRFYPSVLKARQLLGEGRIGRLSYVRGHAGYPASEHSHEWLRERSVMGGGALRDAGIHLIDTTLDFLSEVEEVVGYTTDAVWGFDGCEDDGFLLARDVEGRIATLHASWTEWRGYRFRIELYGPLGCIHLQCFPMITRVWWSESVGGPVRQRRHLFPRTNLMEHLRSYRWVVTRSFERELVQFGLAVRGEPSVIATGGDGLRAVEAAAAAETRA